MDYGLHRSATALQVWPIRLCHTHQHCFSKHFCSTTFLFIELNYMCITRALHLDIVFYLLFCFSEIGHWLASTITNIDIIL